MSPAYRRLFILLLTLPCLCATAIAQQSVASYTVNGYEVATEMAMLLRFHGYEPGAYYIDSSGNYGAVGEPPKGNFYGGPPRNWQGEPQGIQNNAFAQAYVNGVSGTRVFWVYSPGIFSEAKGGSSGYYNICPGQRYYTESEGATNVGGGYGDAGWAGTAGNSRGGGQWSVVESYNGPLLVLNGSDGRHEVLLATLMQGKFKVGQVSYAVEPGKAHCQ